MIKRRIFALMLGALMLFGCAAQAEQNPLTLTAVVVGETETALKAPISGELLPFTLAVGDRVSAGDTLLSITVKTLYAPMDGSVSAVYAKPGDIASAISSRYDALVQLEYPSRWELRCNAMSGYSSLENSDLRVGTPVYLRANNKSHRGNGVITAVEGRSFVVAVLDGDLVYDQSVNVYRTEDYDAKALLAQARISAVAPLALNISGTVVSVTAKRGDMVKAGDPLLCYVPDELEPALRTLAEPGILSAPTDGAVQSLTATPGATVSKGQVLGILRTGMRLSARVNEDELAALAVGQKARATFDALGLEAEATILSISQLGTDAETSQYTVLLTCDCPEGTRYGMHATVAFE